MGDKADLSGNDFLRYWEQDAGTDVVAALPRVVRQPARFGQIARASDGAQAGHRGQERAARPRAPAPPSSHTGALLAASE